MDSLVKSLIRPLLEEKQPGIAIIPGGFKPPTLGHFYLADEVAKRPEVTEAIVLIGHKDRDGITKDQSLAIWNIYKKYLPSNVSIEISEKSSPVSDVHSLIKHNPENFYLPVVGIRSEEDLSDLKRFDSLRGKYDNFEPIVVKSDSTEERISGTNARKAILNGDFESFQRFLPVELSDADREVIWNILTGETIEEKQGFDKKLGKDPYGVSQFARELVKENENLSPFDYDQDGNESRIGRDINNKKGWRRLSSNSAQNSAIKKYLDTYTSGYKWNNPPKSEKFSKENNQMYKTPYVMYVHLLQTSEGKNNIIDALNGMITNEPDNVMKQVLQALLLIFTNKKDQFKKIYEQYKDMIENNAKDDSGANPFAALKYAYENFDDKDNIFKKFKRNGWSSQQFMISENIFESLIQEMYAEPSKFSYPTAMSSLIQHMLSKGMNIRPLPKVKFIDNDEENAQNFFGKTAYYNPDTKEITLFTMDRHPKDIMRSFAHEMIHHEQNCNGKLDNIQTQNTNEEGDLPEIERQAYEKGNMMFRNWTDSITEVKDTFGLVEFVKETFKENLSVEK